MISERVRKILKYLGNHQVDTNDIENTIWPYILNELNPKEFSNLEWKFIAEIIKHNCEDLVARCIEDNPKLNSEYLYQLVQTKWVEFKTRK